VFSLVIMTEPYASHDASKIEPLLAGQNKTIHASCTGAERQGEVFFTKRVDYLQRGKRLR